MAESASWRDGRLDDDALTGIDQQTPPGASLTTAYEDWQDRSRSTTPDGTRSLRSAAESFELFGYKLSPSGAASIVPSQAEKPAPVRESHHHLERVVVGYIERYKHPPPPPRAPKRSVLGGDLRRV